MADMSYQVFVALDATALEGGRIYLGEPNADPETTPINVFWDEALTVLAAQPLLTSGGVIVRDGTPADIFTDVEAYSIRVRDRSGAVVWYKPTTGGVSASRLSFPIPTGPAGADSFVPGPANSTYTSLALLKAAPSTNRSYTLVANGGRTEYAYVTGDFTGRADDVNVVKLDAVPLATGALVIQSIANLSFKQAGTDAVTRPAQAKQRETVSITDFGAKLDGVTDDAPAINKAIQAMATLAAGSRLVFPRGDILANDRLLVTVSRLAILLDGCRVMGNPWRYPNAQLPFGSFFLVTGSYCDLSGTGMGNALIQTTGGSEANGITFLHCDGGSVSNLTLDGAKGTVTAVEDDTFMTGINVLNASVSRPANTPWTRVSVNKVEARNWTQYGMQAYGDLAGAEFTECWVHDNGIGNQAISRGAGVAVTRGNRAVAINRCLIERNKQDGIFQTSAGLQSYDLSFTNNTIRQNGRWGITCSEEVNYACVAGVGTNGIVSSGNTIRENGGGAFPSTGGFRAGTYDNVGLMLNVTSTGDVIQDNIGYGGLLQTNDSANRLAQVQLDSKITGSTLGGLAIGTKLDDTVRWNGNKIRGNSVGDIINFGDSRLVSNARGYGGDIASASTITIPVDGEVFRLTGSTTVNNITPSPGRVITLLFGGTITVSKAGNIVMQADFSGVGNSSLQLAGTESAWIRIAGSMNA